MGISKKTVCIASLIAFFILATGFNAMGAQYSVGSGNDDWWTKYPDQSTGKGGDVNHPCLGFGCPGKQACSDLCSQGLRLLQTSDRSSDKDS